MGSHMAEGGHMLLTEGMAEDGRTVPIAGGLWPGLPCISGGFRGCPPDKCICVTNAYLARNMPRL